MARPFRVEISEAKRLNEGSLTGGHVDNILRELHTLRAQAGQQAAPAPVENAIALWSGVDDIQKRIDTTKKEIGALYARGVANPSSSRNAEELRAVVSGTETATDTILAAAEAIDTVAGTLAAHADDDVRAAAEAIAENIVQVFEACNFQDITGQRITKVVESLGFIEQRIAAMVEIWRAQELTAPVQTEAKSDRDLLNGPALDGDYGVVNQDDVDALFR
jgi:chemotaxis protein CheZ